MITPVAMGTSATTAPQIVPRANIVAAAVEPAQDRVRAAQTSPRTLHIQARAPSMQTTAAGGATQHTFIVEASVTVVRTRAVAQISTARARATTQVATAIDATTAQRTVPLANIVEAAAVRVRAHAPGALISPRIRITPVRAR